MNPVRAQKLNRFIVNDYFSKLEKVLEELQLFDKPDRIYNMDEKGCQLMLHHQQKVLTQTGAKRVHLVAPEHAENATVVTCQGSHSVLEFDFVLEFKDVLENTGKVLEFF